MSANDLRRKAEQRQKKARFEALYSILIGLAGSGLFAWLFVQTHELAPRLGMGVLSLWSVYYAYQAYKWIWPGQIAPDATVNTTLRSYRSALEERRDYRRHLWRRAGLPVCFLGVALVILPALIKSLDNPRLIQQFVPFFVLLAVWLVLFLRSRKRNRGKLQEEIEELREFESAFPQA